MVHDLTHRHTTLLTLAFHKIIRRTGATSKYDNERRKHRCVAPDVDGSDNG